MNIHEHQAKEILRQFEILTPKGVVIFNLNEIKAVLTELRKMDYKIKTLPISEKELMIPFIVKICKGIHGFV